MKTIPIDQSSSGTYFSLWSKSWAFKLRVESLFSQSSRGLGALLEIYTEEWTSPDGNWRVNARPGDNLEGLLEQPPLHLSVLNLKTKFATKTILLDLQIRVTSSHSVHARVHVEGILPYDMSSRLSRLEGFYDPQREWPCVFKARKL